MAADLRTIVVGGGPAGLMAAEVLAGAGVAVDLYDAMPSPGRKFLLAGRGGLNLTHSEPFGDFVARYGSRADRLRAILAAFPPEATRAWAASLGIDTFVGTSGRVFPAEFKAAPLLRAWLRRLRGLGVRLHVRHRWVGCAADGVLLFEQGSDRLVRRADAALLALGGASWPRLGSDGAWVPLLAAAGAELAPLAPANCGFETAWSAPFAERWAGAPLKTIGLSFGGRSLRGEMVVTGYGLEGGAIYALSAPLRDAIARDGAATLLLDLKPDWPRVKLEEKLRQPRRRQSLANVLRRAIGLEGVAYGLVRELCPPDLAVDPGRLAAVIKALPLRLTRPRPLAEAISTAGGVRFECLDERLMLRRRPGLFLAGEMLDWEAPTGGYLLQGCLATGYWAATGMLGWLGRASDDPPRSPDATPSGA